SALPIIPQSVSRGARFSRLRWFATATACQVAGPPCTDLTGLPANGGFYFQAFDGSVTLPVAGYDYNSVWTPLLAGLSPAGMAASLGALVPPRIPGAERPPPPAEMSAREAKIWTDVVDSRPVHYFGRETFPLLEAFCMHSVLAQDLAAGLRQHPRSQKLRDEHRKQTSMIATNSSRLRLGKVGQRKHQSSEVHEASGAPRRRLWLAKE